MGIITDGARGIAVSTTTIYVVDRAGDKVVSYDMAGIILGSFNLHTNNSDPQGLGILNDTLFVVDESGHLVYFYTLPSGASQGTFPLHSSNDDPEGVVSDGTHYWVADEEDKKIYEYGMTGEFVKTLSLVSANGDAEGLEVFYSQLGP